MQIASDRPSSFIGRGLLVLGSRLREHPRIQGSKAVLRVLVILASALLLGGNSAAAGADGTYLVGGADDPNRPKDGDTPRGELLSVEQLRSHRYDERFAVDCVTISPNGKEVAAIGRLSRRGPLAWAVDDGRRLQLPPMKDTARKLTYDFAMTRIAVSLPSDVLAGSKGGIDIHDLKTGRVTDRLDGGDNALDLTFSPDGGALLAATEEGVIAWDLGSKRPEPIPLTSEPADSLTFTSSDRLVITARGGSLIQQYSFEQARVVESLRGKGGDVACISPDSRFAAIGSKDGFRLIDLEGTGPVQFIPHQSEITAMDWGPTGRLLAIGSVDGEVLLFRVAGAGGLRAEGTTKLPSNRTQQGGDRRGQEEVRARRESGERDRDRLRENSSQQERTDIAWSFGALILDQFSGDPRGGRDLEKSLRENSKKLDSCWKKEARRGGKVVGKLHVGMDITAEGEGRKFTEVLEDTIGNEALIDCLEEKLRLDLFPPGLGSLEVELTIELRAVPAP